jgi:hypothetical protein
MTGITADGCPYTTLDQTGDTAGQETGRLWIRYANRPGWMWYGCGTVENSHRAASLAERLLAPAFDDFWDSPEPWPDPPAPNNETCRKEKGMSFHMLVMIEGRGVNLANMTEWYAKGDSVTLLFSGAPEVVFEGEDAKAMVQYLKLISLHLHQERRSFRALVADQG